jgi:hypothetical protein
LFVNSCAEDVKFVARDKAMGDEGGVHADVLQKLRAEDERRAEAEINKIVTGQRREERALAAMTREELEEQEWVPNRALRRADGGGVLDRADLVRHVVAALGGDEGDEEDVRDAETALMLAQKYERKKLLSEIVTPLPSRSDPPSARRRGRAYRRGRRRGRRPRLRRRRRHGRRLRRPSLRFQYWAGRLALGRGGGCWGGATRCGRIC